MVCVLSNVAHAAAPHPRPMQGDDRVDGYPAWRGEKVPSVADLYPKELVSTQAMEEGFLLYGGIS